LLDKNQTSLRIPSRIDKIKIQKELAVKLLKPRLISNIKRLNSQGISHLLVPLVVALVVGVGGTYMLVASHADPIRDSGPGGTAAPSDLNMQVVPEAGAVAANGDKSIAGRVNLRAVDSSGGHVSLSRSMCTGKVKVTYGGPDVITTYRLRFVAPKKAPQDYGYCTAILGSTLSVEVKSGRTVHITADFKGNKYLKDKKATTDFVMPGRQDMTVTVLPELSKDKKSITGVVEVKPSAGGYFSKTQCLREANNPATHKSQGPLIVTYQLHPIVPGNILPKMPTAQSLKYVIPGNDAASAPYCIGKISLHGVKPGQTYTVTANLTATPYMAANQARAEFTVPIYPEPVRP
jgi:hypothetical protein